MSGEPNQKKIICVGHEKSGTTSIMYALQNLGYSVGQCYGRMEREMQWKAGNISQQLLDITTNVLAENDAIQDTPCAHFHAELDAAFPGSKFILTRRPTDHWLRSYAKFFPDICNPKQKWMYGEDRFSGNEEAFGKVYERKNSEIIEYFKHRPDDFLILDLEDGDGWLKLVNFLGEDFLKPFPHENRFKVIRKARKKRRRKYVITRNFYVITIIVLLIIWAYQ